MLLRRRLEVVNQQKGVASTQGVQYRLASFLRRQSLAAGRKGKLRRQAVQQGVETKTILERVACDGGRIAKAPGLTGDDVVGERGFSDAAGAPKHNALFFGKGARNARDLGVPTDKKTGRCNKP